MQWMLTLQALQTLTQQGALAGRVVSQIVPLHHLQHGVGGGATNRIAAEGGDGGLLQSVRNRHGGDQGAQGQAVGDALGHGHHVRLHPVVLDAPDPPGAAKASLHLVGDEHPAVLAHDLGGDGEILRRRRDEAANPLNGLRQQAGHLAAGGGGDELLQVLGAGHPALGIAELQRTAVAIRRRRMAHTDRQMGGGPPAGVAGKPLGQQGAARVAVPQGDDLRMAGVALRHHHRGFVRLAAGGGEKALLQGARRNPRQPLR